MACSESKHVGAAEQLVTASSLRLSAGASSPLEEFARQDGYTATCHSQQLGAAWRC